MASTLDLAALALAVLWSAGLYIVCSILLWPQSRQSARDSGRQRARVRRAALMPIRHLLDSAGFAGTSVGAFLSGSLAVSLGIGALTLLLTPLPVLAACASAVALGAPTLILVKRRARRDRQRASLWPEVADTLISLIRSGSSVVESLTQLSLTMPPSIGQATRRFAERVSVSANVERSLDELKADWADPAGDRIVEALKVTRDVGGTRLTSVLREVSSGLRKSLALRREIEARQSWIRVAAGIGATAPWAVVLLLSTRPEAARAYQSPAGVMLILGGLAVTVIAYRIMTRIGSVSPERRWFA